MVVLIGWSTNKPLLGKWLVVSPNIYLKDGCLGYQERVIFYSRFTTRAEAGFFASFFSLPFDFVKTQMQKQKKDPTTGRAKIKDDIGEETKIAYIDFEWLLNVVFHIEFDEKEQWFKDASKNQQIRPFIFTCLKVFQGLFPGKMFGCHSVLPTTVMVPHENFLKVRGRTQSFQIDKTFCCRVLILQNINPPEKFTQVCASFFCHLANWKNSLLSKKSVMTGKVLYHSLKTSSWTCWGLDSNLTGIRIHCRKKDRKSVV